MFNVGTPEDTPSAPKGRLSKRMIVAIGMYVAGILYCSIDYQKKHPCIDNLDMRASETHPRDICPSFSVKNIEELFPYLKEKRGVNIFKVEENHWVIIDYTHSTVLTIKFFDGKFVTILNRPMAPIGSTT